MFNFCLFVFFNFKTSKCLTFACFFNHKTSKFLNFACLFFFFNFKISKCLTLPVLKLKKINKQNVQLLLVFFNVLTNLHWKCVHCNLHSLVSICTFASTNPPNIFHFQTLPVFWFVLVVLTQICLFFSKQNQQNSNIFLFFQKWKIQTR